jgi:hypothetical protein
MPLTNTQLIGGASVFLVVVVLLIFYFTSSGPVAPGNPALAIPEDDSTNPAWIIRAENQFLVLRNITAAKDSRFAFYPGAGKTYGDPANTGTENSLLGTFGAWTIEELNGAIRVNSSAPGSTWYFYPRTDVQAFGAATVPADTRSFTMIKGLRWVIRQERGFLFFRDLVSGGGYSFAPGSYASL